MKKLCAEMIGTFGLVFAGNRRDLRHYTAAILQGSSFYKPCFSPAES